MVYHPLRWLAAAGLAFALAGCAGSGAQAPTSPATALATRRLQATAVAPSAAPTPSPSPRATPTPAPSATPVPTPSLAPSPTVQPPAERHYQFPVRGQGSISYSRYHHDYPAADIFCPIGSEFVAVTSGTVDFVSREDLWDPHTNDGATRGGLAVAIVGDDGVRYYGSHLSEVADGIEAGVRVAAGQLLGRTGKSGDAASTSPHLHFGISHPTTPDDWAVRRGELPPYPYLKLWQRGEDATPALAR